MAGDEAGSEGGWRILPWMWERKDEILEKLRSLYEWFRRSKSSAEPGPGILIIGPGGAGKSTLGKLLSGEYDFLFDAPGKYDESLEVETYQVAGPPETEIVVPPGQWHRREATWPDLFADIAGGKFRGVILLAPYGYHTLGQTSYKKHPLFRGNKDDFLQEYLNSRRADELQVLQLAPHARANAGRLWFLTLVGKQDLTPRATTTRCTWNRCAGCSRRSRHSSDGRQAHELDY